MSDQNDIRDGHLDPETGTVTDQFFHALPDFGDDERVFEGDSLASRPFPDDLERLLVESHDSADVVL